MAEQIKSMYFNGLGDGRLRFTEWQLIDRQKRFGIRTYPTKINWRGKVTARDLHHQMTERVFGFMENLVEDERFVIQSASAGVHLAIGVAHELNDPRLRVLGYSGRLRSGNLHIDPRKLERSAHLNSKTQASRAFYDGVLAFEALAAQLSQEEKDRILLTIPYFDQIVPLSTMFMEDVRMVRSPLPGHGPSIGWGLYNAPKLIEQLPSSQAA